MQPLTKTETVIDHAATGAAMRKKRKSLSVSASRVAVVMEIPASYLSDLESGRRNWTEERVADYQKALDKITKNTRAKR